MCSTKLLAREGVESAKEAPAVRLRARKASLRVKHKPKPKRHHSTNSGNNNEKTRAAQHSPNKEANIAAAVGAQDGHDVSRLLLHKPPDVGPS